MCVCGGEGQQDLRPRAAATTAAAAAAAAAAAVTAARAEQPIKRHTMWRQLAHPQPGGCTHQAAQTEATQGAGRGTHTQQAVALQSVWPLSASRGRKQRRRQQQRQQPQQQRQPNMGTALAAVWAAH
jgi:hypothetical protein